MTGSQPCVWVRTACDNPSSTIRRNPNRCPICASRPAIMTDCQRQSFQTRRRASVELRTGVFKDLERIKWYRLSGSGPRRRVLSHWSGVLPGVRPASRSIWRTTDGSNTPSKWAGHESPRTTKLYDRTIRTRSHSARSSGSGCEDRSKLRSRTMRVSVMLSTLIAGLDGRLNFEQKGSALAPSSTLPLAHFLYDRQHWDSTDIENAISWRGNLSFVIFLRSPDPIIF
jgi:hypothetical protein